jgi:hypothetical protein
MSSPITGFNSATPSTTISYWSMQINGTAQGVEIGQLLEGAVDKGVIANGTTKVNKPDDTLTWTISITDLNGVDSFCSTGDWIVYGANEAGDIVSIGFYNGQSGKYGNPPYSGAFS